MIDLAAGDDLLQDTLVFLATVLISFGIGWRLDRWLAGGTVLPVLFYAAFLFFIYAKWLYAAHG